MSEARMAGVSRAVNPTGTQRTVLHLRGYDHRTKAQAGRMERREIRILRRLGIGDPYR